MYYIYRQKDPRNNTIRYVGITNNPELRFKQHLLMSSYNDQKNAWVQELQKLGLEPIQETIEIVETKMEAAEKEKGYILHYLAMGYPLLNVQHNNAIPARKKTITPVINIIPVRQVDESKHEHPDKLEMLSHKYEGVSEIDRLRTPGYLDEYWETCEDHFSPMALNIVMFMFSSFANKEEEQEANNIFQRWYQAKFNA